MKIIVLSYVLNELYNNGVFRSSHKLDDRDFLQLSKAAKGSVLRKFYFEEKQNNSVIQFVADNVKEREYKVKEIDRKKMIIDFDFEKDKIIRMPDGNGILRVTGIYSEKEEIDYANNFTKGIAGSEYLYCTKYYLEDTGAKIYISSLDQIRLYASDKPMSVEMLAIIDNDDADIPEDVVWEIINEVLVVALRVVPIPIDSTDDSSPVVQAIKSKISNPQTF